MCADRWTCRHCYILEKCIAPVHCPLPVFGSLIAFPREFSDLWPRLSSSIPTVSAGGGWEGVSQQSFWDWFSAWQTAAVQLPPICQREYTCSSAERLAHPHSVHRCAFRNIKERRVFSRSEGSPVSVKDSHTNTGVLVCTCLRRNLFVFIKCEGLFYAIPFPEGSVV